MAFRQSFLVLLSLSACASYGPGRARIKVVGVGGGGGNAVDRMVETQVSDVEFWALNTDAQALQRSRADRTLQIGIERTRGLGAGGKPSVGEEAAVESRKDIREAVEGADMVFVTAGLGGGTGSGAAPIVAEEARSAGALTVAVVTSPFKFEGRPRSRNFQASLAKLQQQVDATVLVSNDRLMEMVPPDTGMEEAFLVCDNVLRQAIVGTSEIIVQPGLINVDFADVNAVLRESGTCLVGIGTATGKDRAIDAAISAVSCPLMEGSPTLRQLARGELIRGASGVVLNVVGGPDMSLEEVQRAAQVVYDACDPDANIIFGALIDESLGPSSEVKVTVLATGFAAKDKARKRGERAASGGAPPSPAGGAAKPRRRGFFRRLFSRFSS